jgi:hypothetical protein
MFHTQLLQCGGGIAAPQNSVRWQEMFSRLVLQWTAALLPRKRPLDNLCHVALCRASLSRGIAAAEVMCQ